VCVARSLLQYLIATRVQSPSLIKPAEDASINFFPPYEADVRRAFLDGPTMAGDSSKSLCSKILLVVTGVAWSPTA